MKNDYKRGSAGVKNRTYKSNCPGGTKSITASFPSSTLLSPSAVYGVGSDTALTFFGGGFGGERLRIVSESSGEALMERMR